MPGEYIQRRDGVRVVAGPFDWVHCKQRKLVVPVASAGREGLQRAEGRCAQGHCEFIAAPRVCSSRVRSEGWSGI